MAAPKEILQLVKRFDDNRVASMSSMVFETPKFSPRDPQRLRRGRLPPLTIGQILAWADSHHGRTKSWPEADSGYVYEDRNEMWRRIDAALRLGLRGLERGSSLAKLLAAERGKRNLKGLPPLTEAEIASWARQHRRRTGSWPKERSGPIAGTRGEVWYNVDAALRMGIRGLPGGDSLPRLLKRRLGVVNAANRAPLKLEGILRWADDHYEQTGRWPNLATGSIRAAPDRKWSGITGALERGSVRGLRRRCTLADLLAKYRGVRNKKSLPPLTRRKTLAWADAYHEQTGRWPTTESGSIGQAPGEDWRRVHDALKYGRRGLPGGSSLIRLLVKYRGIRNKVHPPRLSVRRLLAWADAHFQETGRWPRFDSGPVLQAPGEKWSAVNGALKLGLRGLPSGTSLAQILAKRRGVPIRPEWPPLTREQILAWADAHFEATGRWPNVNSAAVIQAPAENWSAIDAALRVGSRGLRGGSSLARLLDRERGVRNRLRPPRSRRRKAEQGSHRHSQAREGRK